MVLSNFIATFSPLANDEGYVMYVDGAILVGASLLMVVLWHHVNLEQNRIGMRVRIACSSLVYRKVKKTLKDFIAAKEINYFAVEF